MQAFIRESKKIILDAVNNNKLVIFVGAGVSANSGLPSWGSLVRQFGIGLGMDCDNITHDDYLKIPQYYYNSRGNKEYYDLIKKVFDIKVKPNDIHSIMLELNPSHFITTNFDELIEDAAREKGMFYDVVSKDDDLPYTPNNKMIIKLHGDLKNMNIVLKEDDFLSYSRKFMLIENYIKALLSTHVILFVGYSVNDFDVKLIFQWVKDVLKKNFQPAYFINTDNYSSINDIEYNYYKNRGINMLYFSELEQLDEYQRMKHRTCNLSDDRGIRIYQFLQFLTQADDNAELDLEFYFKKLSVLDKLNRLRLKDITDILNIRTGYTLDTDGYVLVNGDQFKTLILQLNRAREAEDKYIQEMYTFVSRIFIKARIKGFKEIDEHNFHVLFDFNDLLHQDTQCINELLSFQFNELRDISDVNHQVSINGHENQFLKNAFIHYKLQEYMDAYWLLKRISDSAYINKNYLIYFISEFNRQTVGNLIIRKYWMIGIDEDIKNIVKEEIEKIDLENIYFTIPSQQRPVVTFIRELINFNYIYKTQASINDLLYDVEEEANTIYIGGNDDGKVHKLQNEVKSFWEYINYNYLMLDSYTEIHSVYKRFIEGIFMSMSIDEQNIDRETFFGLEGQIVKLRNLDYFSYYIIVNYGQTNYLKKILNKFEILEIRGENIDLFADGFVSLTKSIAVLDNTQRLRGILNNCFVLLSRLNLENEEVFCKICNAITELISSIKVNDENINYLNIFLTGQNNRFLPAVSIQSLDNLLFSILQKNINIFDQMIFENRANTLIDTITKIMKNKDSKYFTKKIDALIPFMDDEKWFNIQIITNMLIPLARVASFEFRKKLSSKIENMLQNNFNFTVYYESVFGKVIDSNLSYEQAAIANIDNIIEERFIEEGKGSKSYPNPVDTSLIQITNLLVNNMIKQPALFKKYYGKNPKFDLFVDVENFDFLQFQVKWVEEFPDWVHENLSSVPKAKESIRSLLKDKMQSGDINKVWVKVFLKYYD